jgi:hypothetical protein
MTDTTRDIRRDGPLAGLGLLIAAAAIVAAIAFVLSYVGLDDYGRRVAGENQLSFLVPLGIDGLTVVAIIATYKLRTAPLHVRAYAWLVFCIALGSSVAGNLSHAVAHHLSRSGQVGAVVWPVFLALASHLVIVVRRWQERLRAVTVEHPAEDEPKEPAPKRQLTPEGYTRQQTAKGKSISQIHQALNARGETVSRSTVGRWVKEAKQQAGTDGETDDVDAELAELTKVSAGVVPAAE